MKHTVDRYFCRRRRRCCRHHRDVVVSSGCLPQFGHAILYIEHVQKPKKATIPEENHMSFMHSNPAYNCGVNKPGQRKWTTTKKNGNHIGNGNNSFYFLLRFGSSDVVYTMYRKTCDKQECCCTTSGFNGIEVKVIIDSWFIYIFEAAIFDENSEITWTSSVFVLVNYWIIWINVWNKSNKINEETAKRKRNRNEMIYELCHKSVAIQMCASSATMLK